MGHTLVCAFLLFILTLSGSMVAPAVGAETGGLASGSGLDCNGYSSSGATNAKEYLICADPLNHTDNGWYIGHDEPALQFFSSTAGSANNLQYSLTLPPRDPIPTPTGTTTANFE